MTPTLQRSNEAIRRKVIGNFIFGQIVGFAFFYLTRSPIFSLLNLVMSGLDLHFARKLVTLHFKLEAEIIIHIRLEGYNSFRKYIAEIDEEAENEPNPFKRRSSMNFAALIRGMGEDINEQMKSNEHSD